MKTQSDNSKLVTKTILKKELKKELKKFETRFEKKIDHKIEITEKVLRAEIRITAEETKKDIKEEIGGKIDKLYSHVDHFLKEIKDSRAERIVIGHQLKNHDNRIGKLEKEMIQIQKPQFA
jgi:hypothetical protein